MQANPASKAPALPKYVVYKHFLDWIRQLDTQARQEGALDPYKFAEPFANRAGLTSSDLDLLKKEADALSADLNTVDLRASRLIANFRKQAKQAAESGKPLPAIPAELRDMQRLRTAIVVHHFALVQASLHSPQRSSLDAYIVREFAPHLSTKQVSAPISVSSADSVLNLP